MDVNSGINPYYQAATSLMEAQLAFLEDSIGRQLTSDEKDNIHEFYMTLHVRTREEFEDRFGSLL